MLGSAAAAVVDGVPAAGQVVRRRMRGRQWRRRLHRQRGVRVFVICDGGASATDVRGASGVVDA